MKKYLAFYENEWPANIAELTAVENKPFVGYLKGTKDVKYTIIPAPVVGPTDNEIWFKANQPMTESNITSAYTDANVIGLKYEDDWYKIVYDDVVTFINWANDENIRLLGSKMTEIYLPDSVTSIGYGAFWGCSSLTSMVIPDSVTSMDRGAFRYCSSLTSITLPNGLTEIGWEAFYRCKSLTSIVIPDSVMSIGRFAFYECSALTSLVIPEGVTSIGERALADCTSLTSITFEGTTEEWNNIEKGYYWNREVPATYIQCSDGQVAL